jgi:hypothetical protein
MIYQLGFYMKSFKRPEHVLALLQSEDNSGPRRNNPLKVKIQVPSYARNFSSIRGIPTKLGDTNETLAQLKIKEKLSHARRD